MTRRMTLRGAISTLGVVEENRRLKAEVRRLRKALRSIITDFSCDYIMADRTDDRCIARLPRDLWCDRCVAREALRRRGGKR